MGPVLKETGSGRLVVRLLESVVVRFLRSVVVGLLKVERARLRNGVVVRLLDLVVRFLIIGSHNFSSCLRFLNYRTRQPLLQPSNALRPASSRGCGFRAQL